MTTLCCLQACIEGSQGDFAGDLNVQMLGSYLEADVFEVRNTSSEQQLARASHTCRNSALMKCTVWCAPCPIVEVACCVRPCMHCGAVACMQTWKASIRSAKEARRAGQQQEESPQQQPESSQQAQQQQQQQKPPSQQGGAQQQQQQPSQEHQQGGSQQQQQQHCPQAWESTMPAEAYTEVVTAAEMQAARYGSECYSLVVSPEQAAHYQQLGAQLFSLLPGGVQVMELQGSADATQRYNAWAAQLQSTGRTLAGMMAMMHMAQLAVQRQVAALQVQQQHQAGGLQTVIDMVQSVLSRTDQILHNQQQQQHAWHAMLLSQQHAAQCLQSVGQQQTSLHMAVTDLATSAALHGRGSATNNPVAAAHAQQQQQHRISRQAAMAAAAAGAGQNSSRASRGAGRTVAAEAACQPRWLPSSGKWEKWPGEKGTLAGMVCAWQAAAVLSGGQDPCSGVSQLLHTVPS